MTDLPVKTAHLQWAEPTIAEGVKACVEDGAEEIVAVPVLLSPGKHSTSDIPQQLKSAATHCPGVRCRLTPPLGPDPRIAQVILERIEEGGALEDC
jgi:sirohydrochlorin ferrochelatase